MDAKREQAMVGLFVIVASALLLATIFALSGAFGRAGATYRAHFPFAGGLEPGNAVRFGGLKAGRVETVRVDPENSTRIEVVFSVRPGLPVKTDSVAKISSLGALGENYLEITTGTAQAALAPDGSLLKSEEFVGFGDLTAKLSELGPDAQKLLQNLNQRVVELQETITRVNDLLNEQNRDNVGATIRNLRGMLEENRPTLKSAMSNVDVATGKVPPLLDDFKRTVERADKALANVDAMVVENREDIRKAIVELRDTLTSASQLVEQLNRTLTYNAENLDETLENVRITTENLKQFTDTIKARPASLIRSSGPPDRKPGEAKPQ
jgi:phospholipid/cholesterol/gamma-HCH transport system substrate-binding protein